MKIKRAGIITKLVILILIVYAVITLITLRERIGEASAQESELEAARDDLRRTNENYRYEIDHSSDEDTIAEIARDKLGLVYPGERVFYDISN